MSHDIQPVLDEIKAVRLEIEQVRDSGTTLNNEFVNLRLAVNDAIHKCDVNEEKVSELRHTVFGNGQQGLKAQVQQVVEQNARCNLGSVNRDLIKAENNIAILAEKFDAHLERQSGWFELFARPAIPALMTILLFAALQYFNRGDSVSHSITPYTHESAAEAHP